MDEHRDEVRVERVGPTGVSRAVPILTFLIGIFLGAALFKPWDLVFPPSSAAVIQGPGSFAEGSAEPTPAPSPSGPPAECAFAGGWRVFALGQPDPLGGDGSSGQALASDDPTRFADIGNPLRRWLEVDPLPVASGPADRRIPFVTIVSDQIGGMGYCPPPDGTDGPPPGARLDAWVLDATGTPTTLPLQAVRLRSAIAIEVGLFIGSDQPVGPDARWAPGRYVFAVRTEDPGGYSRWFGVEIRSPPGKLPD